MVQFRTEINRIVHGRTKLFGVVKSRKRSGSDRNKRNRTLSYRVVRSGKESYGFTK